MPEKFTILPSFTGEEANTAVLKDGGLSDQLLQSARIKHAMDEARHIKAQDEMASSINFASGDLLKSDEEFINAEIPKYLQWIKDNSQELYKRTPSITAQQKEWKRKIDTQISIGIGRKQLYDQENIYLRSQGAIDSGYGTEEHFKQLDEFATTAQAELKPFAPPDMYNELTYFNNYYVETEKNVDDKGYTKTTTDTTPTANILARAEYMMNNPIEYNRLVKHYLGMANAAKNGTTQNVDVEYYDPEDFRKNGENATPKVIKLADLTPDNIGSIVPYKKSALDEAYKNLKQEDKQVPTNPKSDDNNNGSNLPDGYSNQDVDKSFEVLKGTGGTSSKGEVYKTSYKVTYENGKKVSKEVGKEKIEDSTITPLGGGSLTVTLKDNNGRDKEYSISSIIKVGDKLYFGVKGADGKYEMTPNYEIKDYFQDVIQPIYNRQYQATGNAAKALTEAQIYAWQTDPVSAAKLGYPKPLGINLNNSTNTTSTTNNPLNATTIKSGGNSNQKKNPNPTTNTINATNKVNGTTQTTTTVAPQNTTVAPKTNTPVAPNSTTSAPTTTNSSAGKSQQPQNDITNNYLNVLGKQYESMGKYKPDSYKNTWQYRPLQIDKNYDEAIKTVGNKRKDGALLTDAGYEAIDKFELGDKKDGSNNGGAPDGGSMRGKEDLKKNIITDGYSKTQEAEIKDYVENNIGMDIWNQLPEKLQTQVYSLAFNSVKDDRIIKGLAQALAPDKIKTDADRQKLTADEAKSIINNYFGKTTPPVTPKTTTTTPTAPQSTTTNTTNNVKPLGLIGGNASNPNADKTVTEPKKNDNIVVINTKGDIDESKVDSTTTQRGRGLGNDVYFQGKKYKFQSNVTLTPKDEYGKQYYDTKNHPETGWFIDTEKGRYFSVNGSCGYEFCTKDYWKKDDGKGSSPYKGKDIPNEAIYRWNDKNSEYSKDISMEKPNDLEVSVKSANYGDKEWTDTQGEKEKFPSKINGKTTIYYSKSQGKYYRIQNTEAKGDIYVIVEKDAKGNYFDKEYEYPKD